ncbi:hypothetical protein CPB86DRAFT_793438 [Serendipita vermifera]|nr:hypothetical protein CPB86DRAFT_793438 [Serendipita vermifera]
MSSIPLVPSLVLGLLSFLVSSVLLVNILWPTLLSLARSCRKRAAQTHVDARLNPAAQAHLLLILFDIICLVSFIAQVISQHIAGYPDTEAPKFGGAAALFWIALTARQSCLLVILIVTTCRIRLIRLVSYKRSNLCLWLPAIGMVVIGTVAAAVLAAFGYASLFGAIATYLSILTAISTGMITYLAWMLRLGASKQAHTNQVSVSSKKLSRHSIATDDIQALKERSSWLTSLEGSLKRSMSPWSFTTNNTSRSKPKHSSRFSLPSSLQNQITGSLYSEYGGTRDSLVPPVPPLPPQYRQELTFEKHYGTSNGTSVNSWLTSLSGTRKTMSAFSFPTTKSPSSKNISIKSISTRNRETYVLASAMPVAKPIYFVPADVKAYPSSGPSPLQEDLGQGRYRETLVTVERFILQLALIWIPFMLAMPYLVTVKSNIGNHSTVVGFLLLFSVIVPSPLIAVTVARRSTIALQFKHISSTFHNIRAPLALPTHRQSSASRVRAKSGSYTVVEGRRSGDIWVENGEAVEGLSKASRIASLLVPYPKLAVLPPVFAQDTEIQHHEPPVATYNLVASTIKDMDIEEIAVIPKRSKGIRFRSSISPVTREGPSNSVDTPKSYKVYPSLKFQQPRSYPSPNHRRNGHQSMKSFPSLPSDSFPEEVTFTRNALPRGIVPPLDPGTVTGSGQSLAHYPDIPSSISSISSNSSSSSYSVSEDDGAEIHITINAIDFGIRKKHGDYFDFESPDAHPTPHLPTSPGTQETQEWKPLRHTLPTPTQTSTFYRSLSNYAGHSRVHTTGRKFSLAEDDTIMRKMDSLISLLDDSGPSPNYNVKGTRIFAKKKKETVTRSTSSSPSFGPVRTKVHKQRFSPLQVRSRKASNSNANFRFPNHLRSRDNDGTRKVNHRRSQAISVPINCRLPLANGLSTATTKTNTSDTNQKLNSSYSKPRSLSIYPTQPTSENSAKDILSYPVLSRADQMPRTRARVEKKVKSKENIGLMDSGGRYGPSPCSDTARERKRLMLTQKLPRVVISPPSGDSMRESNSNSNSGSLSWKEMI